MLHEIHLRNLLSFGPVATTLPLRGLNVFIGANGTGKSNLIAAIGLLQSAPRLLAAPVRESGGVGDWLHKGRQTQIAELVVVVENPHGTMPLRHSIAFTETSRRFDLVDERIENKEPSANEPGPYYYYRFQGNQAVLNVLGTARTLRREDVDPEKSILSQRKDPDQYPEITYLGEQFDRIRIYREWSFGRYPRPREPQKADQRNDFLDEDCTNLGLVLNRLRRDAVAKSRLLEALGRLYGGIDDFDVSIEGGAVQVFLQEGRLAIPATRLSDGTLRYLCLLAVLCHPEPPPLLCIEEPELGLHPDAIVGVGELLRDASTRTQLIVTTHSEVLLDCLSSSPEDVVVCEKNRGQTTMQRLDRQGLATWLDTYSLGQLWRRGEIGGNRW